MVPTSHTRYVVSPKFFGELDIHFPVDWMEKQLTRENEVNKRLFVEIHASTIDMNRSKFDSILLIGL